MLRQAYSFFILLFFIFCWIAFHGCGDEKDCYDPELEANHSGICTQDCPQVCGCDGKTYCNTCIANSKGIVVEHEGPCK